MAKPYLYLLFAFGKLRYVSILFVQSNDKSNLPNLFKSSMLFLNIAIKSLLSLSHAEISKLASEEFLDYSFLIEYRYKKIFAGIKNINSLLPENPSPEDEKTIAALKEILKNESVVI